MAPLPVTQQLLPVWTEPDPQQLRLDWSAWRRPTAVAEVSHVAAVQVVDTLLPQADADQFTANVHLLTDTWCSFGQGLI